MEKFIGTFKECLTAENGDLSVVITVPKAHAYEAKKSVSQAKILADNGKITEITIKEHKEKRSLNANNYFWQLCEKIAERLNSTKTEIYQKYVHEYGQYKEITIDIEAEKAISTVWQAYGLGWVVDKIDTTDNEVTLHCYYGSSVYSKKRMARLIDGIVQDAKDLEIETRTPDEIALLKARWGE